MIAHHAELANAPDLLSLTTTLLDLIRHAAQHGRTAHEVERDLFHQLLALGRQAFAWFLKLQGTGDLGPHLTLPDGSDAQRLEQTHTRDYRTIFGAFTIERNCYGSREGQAMTYVPVDNRLQLPESDYSYLLQQWGQVLAVESAFGRVADTLEEILKVKQPVDSLERINRNMAAAVEPFREQRPVPEPKDEGEVFVVSADGKGIVMRRNADDPKPKAHRNKGDKANKKRMAIVGAIYSVDRHVRTAEDVTAALFRDAPAPPDKNTKRPEPVGKHVWGRMSRAKDGSLGEPIDAVFGWQAKELARRNTSGTKDVVCVMDGQEG